MGRARVVPPERICIACGRAYGRGPKIGLTQYFDSRFCGRSCAARAQFTVPLTERFWTKVNKQGGVRVSYMDSDCWEWTASLDSGGYGQIGKGGRARGKDRASRVSWELVNGPIPMGLWVLHRCDNRKCVRPEHLFLGTVLDNNRDTASKGRFAAQKDPSKYLPALYRCWATTRAKAAARPDPVCIHCKRIITNRRRWAGRCGTCNEYFRRNGRDRGAELFSSLEAMGRAGA